MTFSIALPDLPPLLYEGGAAVVLLLLLFLIVFVRRRRRRSAPVLTLQPDLEGVDSLDRAVAQILHQVARWLPAVGYYAYWLSADGAMYQLRASITGTGNPAVVPDYSGLIIEEAPVVPLSLTAQERPVRPTAAGNKADPRLVFALGQHLVVRARLDRQQRLRPGLMQRLSEADVAFSPLMLAVYEWFKAREAGERVRGLVQSSRVALDSTLRPERAMELMLQVGGRVLEADLHCAMVAGATEPVVLASTAEGNTVARRILQGEVPNLLVLPTAPDVVPGQNLGVLANRFNGCVRVPVLHGNKPLGCLFYFLEYAPRLNQYQTAVLKVLGERTAQVVASQRQLQSASAGYAQTLRALVDAMDGLTPHGVGHSYRLARLARLTAQEMGATPAETEAIAAAAYYHDVGMVAIDPKVALKPGRLTPDEYEQFKGHAELGAQLVAPLYSAVPLAPLVASHHERWDGHGYPGGLKGEDIPLGARIIAAADLFDVKTTGRSYRAPLPFDRALADLVAAGGTHLDPRVATAFAAVWERQRRTGQHGMPLSRCWELKQMPEHICAGCANRVNTLMPCWENRNHLCIRHGDRCENCFIYTEAVSRGMALPGAAGLG